MSGKDLEALQPAERLAVMQQSMHSDPHFDTALYDRTVREVALGQGRTAAPVDVGHIPSTEGELLEGIRKMAALGASDDEKLVDEFKRLQPRYRAWGAALDAVRAGKPIKQIGTVKEPPRAKPAPRRDPQLVQRELTALLTKPDRTPGEEDRLELLVQEKAGILPGAPAAIDELVPSDPMHYSAAQLPAKDSVHQQAWEVALVHLFHAANLTDAEVSKLAPHVSTFNDALETVYAEARNELAAEFDARAVAELREHFGDAYDERIAGANKVLEKYLGRYIPDDDERAAFLAERLESGPKIGSVPTVIMFLSDIADALAESEDD